MEFLFKFTNHYREIHAPRRHCENLRSKFEAIYEIPPRIHAKFPAIVILSLAPQGEESTSHEVRI